MPLKIRCPHCYRVLVADESTAGQGKRCPACGLGFTVPVPTPSQGLRTEVARACPRCRSDVAPGTAVCPRCHTVVATGKRLPLKRRLPRISLRAWTRGALAGAVVIALAFVGSEVYRNRRPRPQPSVAAVAAPASAPVVTHNHKNPLLEGAPAEASVALEALLALGQPGVREVAALLKETAPAALNVQRAPVVAQALEALGAHGDRSHAELVGSFRHAPGLEATALRAAARLGDREAAFAVAELWQDRLRSRLFYGRLREVLKSGSEHSGALVTRIQNEELAFSSALQATDDETKRVLACRLLERDWDSWSWLGQARDEAYAAELFEVLKPPRRATLDFAERIRASRRTIDAAAHEGSTSAAAAAGLVLAQAAPQYQSLRGRIGDLLKGRLPRAAPLEQQRAVWALSRLSGQPFAGAALASHPQWIDADAVAAALRWAGAPHDPDRRLPDPPRFTRRVVTPPRQLEQDLLARMESGWRDQDAAVARWREAGLGYTPRVEALLDPRQRSPRYPALAAAMSVAAESGATEPLRYLEVWSRAADQPAWLRALAATAAASIRAQRGTDDAAWLTLLTDDALAGVGANQPAWTLWGRLVQLGGGRMTEPLRRDARSLSRALRDRLLFEAQRSADRQPGAPRP